MVWTSSVSVWHDNSASVIPLWINRIATTTSKRLNIFYRTEKSCDGLDKMNMDQLLAGLNIKLQLDSLTLIFICTSFSNGNWLLTLCCHYSDPDIKSSLSILCQAVIKILGFILKNSEPNSQCLKWKILFLFLKSDSALFV